MFGNKFDVEFDKRLYRDFGQNLKEQYVAHFINFFFLKMKEGCKRISLVIRSLLPWLSILKTLLSQVDIVIMTRLL